MSPLPDNLPVADGASTDAVAAQQVEIAVVLVYYAGASLLDRCLRSLPAAVGRFSWRAVVVDNSELGLAADGWDAHIELLRTGTNLGFARGVNEGARRIRAPWLLLLNPDAEPAPGSVARLVQVLQAERSLALVGPRVVDEEGRLQGSARRDPSLLTGLIGRRSWLRRMAPHSRLARREVLDACALEKGREIVLVDWVSGACQLIRREAFDQVGGFDERFFLYFEDADLCRRLRAAGWGIGYVPGAQVIHREGGASRCVPELALRAFHESAFLYYATHVARGRWHPMRPVARALLGARRRLIGRSVRRRMKGRTSNGRRP